MVELGLAAASCFNLFDQAVKTKGIVFIFEEQLLTQKQYIDRCIFSAQGASPRRQATYHYFSTGIILQRLKAPPFVLLVVP